MAEGMEVTAKEQSLQDRFEGLNEQILEGHQILDRSIPRGDAKGDETPPAVGAVHSAEACRLNLQQLLQRMRELTQRVGLL